LCKTSRKQQRVDRTNGTQKERFKVQRRWKKMPILEAQKIHYHFVKPHISLGRDDFGVNSISHRSYAVERIWPILWRCSSRNSIKQV
jgi:hypothetical protein